LRTDESGVSAIVVAVSLVGILAATILSVDAGQLWANRRNMITATDASSLAEAQQFARNPSPGATSCTNEWSVILNANVTDLSGAPTCSVRSVSADGTSGVVIVQGRKRSGALFSRVLGIGDSAAFSSTASMWGSMIQVTGLRPIALCTYDPEVQDGLLLHGTTQETHIGATYPANYLAPDNSKDFAQTTNQGPTGVSSGVVHHTVFNSSCNGAPGNWGWINLQNYGAQHSPPLNCESNNCQNMSSNAIATWLQNGYYGNNITLTSPTDCDSSAPNNQTCNGNTGSQNANAINCAMNYLMDPSLDVNSNQCAKYPPPAIAPQEIPIILYDSTVPGSTGSNAQFNLIGVAFIRIWGYNLSGGNRYLDIEFTRKLFQGVCCSRGWGIPGSAPSAPGIKICDTDHDPADPTLTGARCTFG
jgi:hypothetical protein